MKIAWVIEGSDEVGTWWIGTGPTFERALETAMRFSDRRTAEVYAAAVNAKVYQVVF